MQRTTSLKAVVKRCKDSTGVLNAARSEYYSNTNYSCFHFFLPLLLSPLSSRDRAAEWFDGQSRLQQAEGDGGR